MLRKIIILLFLSCCLASNSFSQLYINEFLAANASVNYEKEYYNFPAWIEIYNSGTDTVEMKNFYLTDNSSMPDKWQFPGMVLLPKQYLVIWADNNNSGLHTSFSLDPDGEFIGLYDSLKKPVDSLSFGKQYPNVSLGRTSADSSVWKFFGKPTPAAPNTTPSATVFSAQPLFMLRSGYYPGAQSLLISCSSTTAKIYYTTDGSEPNELSSLYSVPVSISSTTVIRARSYDAGFIPSEIVTRTYFINDRSTLPVVSVTVPPVYLWDDTIGIYTVGENGVSNGWGKPANYNREWERAAHVEFYEQPESLSFQTYCGVEIYGSASRAFSQKSLDIKIKDKYGNGKIKYRLFKDREYDNIHSFVLRNSGNDWQDVAGYGYGLLFRDGMIHAFTSGQMDVDYMAYRPCLVYLNGQFWGISDLREKLDKYYCNNLFTAVDKDSLEMIKQTVTDQFDAQEGSNVLLKDFITYLDSADIENDSVYARIKDSVDMREFINYLIVETYSNNIDWPNNNVKLWRQPGVVKWRWMLFDLDFGFAGFGDPFSNMISKAYNIGGYKASAIIMFQLMRNAGFRNEFAQTYAAHLNITYQTNRIKTIMDSIAMLVKPEVERHSIKWKNQGSIQSMESWTKHLSGAHAFATTRPGTQWNHLKGVMGLYDMSNLCIRRSDPDKGMVYVQGATLCDSFNIGSYFNHLPIELQAVPKKGYYFIWWEIRKKGIVTHSKNLFLADTINTAGIYDTVFYTAVFRMSPNDTSPPPPIIISVPPPPPPGILSDISAGGPALYPNPVANKLEIYYPGSEPVNIRIVSVSGAIVHEQVINGGVSVFDASPLPAGLYSILFISPEEISVRRFIKH